MNQHVPAKDEINATGSERESLDIALDEFDWTAVLVQKRTPKRRKNYVDTKRPAIEPFGDLNAVVTPAASYVYNDGSRAKPRFSGDIEEEGPQTRPETSIEQGELVGMCSPQV